MTPPLRHLPLTLALILASAGVVSAQTRPESRWQIEAYGGMSATRSPQSGSLALPPPGPPILTSNPIFPSRQTPSWFFGDGAALLNDSLADFGISNQIAPLDQALATRPFDRRTGIAAGVRVRRTVTRRFDLEVSVDWLATPVRVRKTLTDVVESARASFQDAFTALFASGPFIGTTVDATSTAVNALSRQLALTGALIVPLGEGRGWAPYVSIGGGVLTRVGRAPSISLAGHYKAVAHAGVPIVDVPIEQFDRVTIRFDERPAAIGAGGAGLTRALTQHWSLRVDARALVGVNTTRVAIDAAPSTTTATPASVIELYAFPALVFSNNASTGRQSTLTGPGVQDFAVFKGTGTSVRTLVTVGLVRRF